MRKVNPNIRALKLIHSFCPSYFPIVIANSFFEKLSPFFNLYLSAEIVNEIAGVKDKNRLVLLVIITVIGNFLITIIGGVFRRILEHKETLLTNQEAAYYNKKTLTLDYADLENTEVRQLRRKITESAMIDNHGKQLLVMSIVRFINTSISAILAIILGLEMFALMFSKGLNWYIVLFVALTIGLVVFDIYYSFVIKDKLGALSREVSQTMIDENRIDDAIDCYNMGKDVRLYRQDKLIMKIKNYSFDLHKKAFRMMAQKHYIANIPLTIVNFLLQAVIYLFVSIYALIGAFGIGSIIKYVGFVETIINSMLSYFNIFTDIKYNTPFIEDYLKYFDLPQKMQQGFIHIDKNCFLDSNNNSYEFEFCNVSFRYSSSNLYALKNINIKFRSGERLAVVGENGSGKTTFIKLLVRLYDPTEGEIKLNGIDIREYNYEEYLSIFSVVFQDFKLFSFSLGQNIATMPEYNAEKVYDCLQKSGFEDRLAEMPMGLETYLYKDFDEEGIEISGGEAQKIAFARALYRNAPFIVLDEPTAALDPISEYEIYTHFNEIAKNKSTIFISHRLSSCHFCDKIAVFDHGSIVQFGNHDELLKDKTGKYSQLWHSQAQYYT